MKQSLEYTLVAEGFAEYSFIPVYLKRIASARGLQVKRSSLDLLKKQPSKSKVIQEAEDLCLRALRDEQQAFCIVGVDLDGPDHTDEQKEHTAECDKLKRALNTAHKRYQGKIAIFVTVQAIEHWLFYQLHQVKSVVKPASNSIEKETQAKLKKILYSDREDRRQIESVARSVAEKADFDELAKQSRSFNHFHKQITAFLNEYNKLKS